MKAGSTASAMDMMRQCTHWSQQLFDANPVPMIIYDQGSLKVLKFNDSAAKHYGYSASEWANMTVTDLYLQQDIPAIRQEASVARGDDFHHAGTWRQQTKDRSQLDVDVFQCLIDFNEKMPCSQYSTTFRHYAAPCRISTRLRGSCV